MYNNFAFLECMPSSNNFTNSTPTAVPCDTNFTKICTDGTIIMLYCPSNASTFNDDQCIEPIISGDRLNFATIYHLQRLRACLVCERSGVQIPDRPNFTQRCKRFATASTSIQVVVLPWRYGAEMGTANSLQ